MALPRVVFHRLYPLAGEMSSESPKRAIAFWRGLWYNGRMKMMNDPVMLLSFVNLKLRDEYDSPDALCDDLEWDRAELEGRLAALGRSYDAQSNQYR